MGMTLLQVAEKLHVDTKSLEAVEAERFSEFPAPVYVKGHLKRYADLVGESTQQILDEYAAATKPVMPDLTQIPKVTHHSTDPKKLVLPSLVVLIAFALVGTIWWVLQNVNLSAPVEQPASTVPTESAADVSATSPDGGAATASSEAETQNRARTSASPSDADASSRAAPATSRSSSAAEAPSEASAPVRARIQPPQQVSPPRRGFAGGGAPVNSAAKAQAVQRAANPTSASSEPQQPKARAVEVTLKFAKDSYVEIYDAAGERLFADIGSANSSRNVRGTPPLRVVLGNAPGVSLNINGKPVKVPASAVREDSAQFTINRAGRIVRTRPDGG
jgi:cytoskeleton protein RodZ